MMNYIITMEDPLPAVLIFSEFLNHSDIADILLNSSGKLVSAGKITHDETFDKLFVDHGSVTLGIKNIQAQAEADTGLIEMELRL